MTMPAEKRPTASASKPTGAADRSRKSPRAAKDPLADARGPDLPARWPLWIGGGHAGPRAGEYFSTFDPSTGETLAEVARGRPADVDAAVAAARDALPGWSRIPVARRGRILLAIAEGLRRAEDELATLESLNSGKPLREARTDVVRCAEAFEFYAGAADKLFGSTIPIAPEYFSYTVREPIGVTAHVAPWNFPLRLALRSIAPALAAGNTVVLKPASQTPLTALRLGPLFAEAGLPAGVFNVVTGGGTDAGTALVGHPGINHVAFTGSLATGIDVMKRAAENVVPVTLELGGKSPNIVFADADLPAALAGAVRAIFTNAGQVCLAGSRLLLHRPVYDRFVSDLIDRTRRIRLGPALSDPDMGPLISDAQRGTVREFVELGRSEGGRVLTGGGVPSDPACRRGFFFEPTLVETTNSSRLAREEIFGPVLAIIPFRDDDEAVTLANDNPYGLVAAVWTTDIDRALRLASSIQAGQVFINDYFSGSVACPFGGYKRSGIGRERGIEALSNYTQIKSVTVRLKG